MRIKILNEAENDIEEGYRFYERQYPGLGTYFLDSIYSDIDALTFFGGIHQRVFGYHHLLSKRFPFAIYYRLIIKVVVIFAVLDCRRDPDWIKERLTKG